jgi:CHAT domain-containing protein/Tfp pilus assembly protein PilF
MAARCRRSSGLALFSAALFLCGCGGEARRNPEALYARAKALRQASQLPKAFEEATLGFSAWRQDTATSWHWNFRVLQAEILLLRGDIPGALKLLGEEPGARVPDRLRITARLLCLRGYSACYDSPLPEAGDFLSRAYEIAQHPEAQDVMPQIRMTRAICQILSNQFTAAEKEIRAVLADSERLGDRFFEATALAQMGFLRLRDHRYDESIEWSRRALAIAQSAGYDGVRSISLGNLGWGYYRLGDFEKAEAHMRDAEALNRRMGRLPDQENALGNIGSVRFSMEDYQGALEYYLGALDLAEKARSDSTMAVWLNNLATTCIETGDLTCAERHNRRALELQARVQDKVVGVWPVLNSANIALARADYAGARQTFESALVPEPEDADVKWEIHSGLARVYAAQGNAAGARAEFTRAINVLDERWSELRNDHSKLTFPTRALRFYRRYVDFLMLRGRDEEALNFVESRRARLLSEEAAGNLKVAARQTGAVLLSYWLAPERSYLWVVSPGGIRTFVLPGEDKIRELVDRYSKAILDSRDTIENPAGRQLFDMLIAPARQFLPPGSRVVLVPDGRLHGLNFETLITDAGRYWIEEATVEIAPSLRLLRGRGSERAGSSILLIGDPADADPSLPRLPFAQVEIAEIATLFPDKMVLTGTAARPEAYRSAEPSRYSVIHFAAHALPNRESPLDSAVVLSPGKDSYKLYAWEVRQVPLNAALVTVSACRSAGARAYAGEGLVGFAWAFLGAGARNVVASLWDVNDRSTAAFMQALYKRIRSNESPAAALREVKLEFLRSGEVRRKPYYWAPFQLYMR